MLCFIYCRYSVCACSTLKSLLDFNLITFGKNISLWFHFKILYCYCTGVYTRFTTLIRHSKMNEMFFNHSWTFSNNNLWANNLVPMLFISLISHNTHIYIYIYSYAIMEINFKYSAYTPYTIHYFVIITRRYIEDATHLPYKWSVVSQNTVIIQSLFKSSKFHFVCKQCVCVREIEREREQRAWTCTRSRVPVRVSVRAHLRSIHRVYLEIIWDG